MSDHNETEIPGISKSDLPDLLAGARLACGSNDFADRVFAEILGLHTADEAEAASPEKTFTE